ncbi:MAG: ABC transporter permease subunit [Crocinitomicaceae bacterium]|nr:ABC transporter permease subunit [Crocinitomicaceae bacterium]
MRALYFKEIRSFLSSIIGFIFVFIFLVATGIFHWVIPGGTNLLEGAEADLIPFFNLAPILFFILIPALTMRSIAEERRTGTIELLFTRPISDLKIILAKYFAGVTLLVIALIPTIVYYFSMYNLSLEPEKFDHGATITSYIGLILLGAVFVAIGIFSSSLTNSQIVAFIISMFLCWLFFDGLNRLGAFNVMGKFDVVLQYFGMVKHYDSIRKGVIDTSDIIYFLSLIVFFIFSSLTVIKTLKR